MTPRAVILTLGACAAMCVGAVTTPCLAKAPPKDAPRIEVKLTSGKVVRGWLIAVDPDAIGVHRGGIGSVFYDPKITLPRGDIVGIRGRRDAAFVPWPPAASTLADLLAVLAPAQTPAALITVRVYDKLPLMALAIAGGAFACNRLGRASAEEDLARSLDALGADDYSKRELRERAKSHREQASLGILVGSVGLVLACIPSHQELPLPIACVNESGNVGVGFSIPLLRKSASVRLLFMTRTAGYSER